MPLNLHFLPFAGETMKNFYKNQALYLHFIFIIHLTFRQIQFKGQLQTIVEFMYHNIRKYYFLNHINHNHIMILFLAHTIYSIFSYSSHLA
jgi:hypothetical protein